MPSVGKKLHHYVPRFYLRAWAENEFVYCLQNGEIIRPNIRNVGAENHFYRLRELNPGDVEFIRNIAIKDSPEKLKPAYERLVQYFSLPHAARRRLQKSGNANPKLLAQVDKVIAELNEDLHTSIEEQFKPYLDSMMAGNLAFYNDPAASAQFFWGIAAQFLRTNQSKRVRLVLGADQFEIFERVVNVVVHIYAANLGYSLYLDRERYRIALLENESEIPFVTADQPVINVAANPESVKEPEKFEMYYPLSPKKAMLLVNAGSAPHDPALSGMSVHLYNLHLAAHSHQQVFANSPDELASVRSDLPAFRSCFRTR